MTGVTVERMIRARFGVAADVRGERAGRDRYFSVFLPEASTADPNAGKRAVKELTEGQGYGFTGCGVYRGRDLGGPVLVSDSSASLFGGADASH
jgi:hypothetical protein